MLSEELIVYQVGERITAADPLTGEPRWIRENARPNSRIFGDEKNLAVVAPDATSAFIARAADGEILNVVNLPEADRQVAYLGMHLIAWTTGKNQQYMESRHLASGKTHWKIACPEGTAFRKVGTEELALFQPGGKFLVVSLADGKAIVNANLDFGKVRHTHEVLRLANCYLLLSAQDNPAAGLGRNPFLSEASGTPVNGPVHAFDRALGKLLWKTRIENQSLEKLPPENSPVIVFNKRRLPGQGVGGFGDNSFRVRVLDLRTGDIIYQNNQLQNVSPLGIRVEPADKKVTVTFYEGVIEVELTKDALEPSRS
jgi:outer membrane protein assembly factor BamB